MIPEFSKKYNKNQVMTSDDFLYKFSFCEFKN